MIVYDVDVDDEGCYIKVHALDNSRYITFLSMHLKGQIMSRLFPVNSHKAASKKKPLSVHRQG